MAVFGFKSLQKRPKTRKKKKKKKRQIHFKKNKDKNADDTEHWHLSVSAGQVEPSMLAFRMIAPINARRAATCKTRPLSAIKPRPTASECPSVHPAAIWTEILNALPRWTGTQEVSHPHSVT